MSAKMKASKKRGFNSKEAYKYPSAYGSHQSMVDATVQLSNPKFTACKDEDGIYVTEKANLDSGLADPYRCASVEFRKIRLEKYTLSTNATSC